MFSTSRPKQPPHGHPEASQGANGSAKFSRMCCTAEPRARLARSSAASASPTRQPPRSGSRCRGVREERRVPPAAGYHGQVHAGDVRLVIQPFCRRERLKTDRSHATTALQPVSPVPSPERRAFVCLESAAMPTFGLQIGRGRSAAVPQGPQPREPGSRAARGGEVRRG